MIKKITLLVALALAAPLAHAEQSWWESALEFVGLGPDKPEVKPQAEPAVPTKSNASEAKTEAKQPEQPASVMSKAVTMAKGVDAGALTALVTSQMGGTTGQTEGALGSLFGLAKSNLADGDFSKLSSTVPNMDSLLAAAPKISEQTKGITSLMGNAGKYANVLKGATTTYSQFKTLGIGADKIPGYIDVTSQYLQSEGGEETVALFKQGVGALFSSDES